MKKIYKAFAGVCSAGILSLLALILYVQLSLPDNLYVAEGEDLFINSSVTLVSLGKKELPVTKNLIVCGDDGSNYRLDLKLFEKVPIKQVQVQVVPRNMVIPSGAPFGIKMFTDGVMIVGMSDIQNGTETLSPAKDAGLKVGDILVSIDETPLARNDDVARLISASQGNEVKLTVNRDGQEMDLYVKPVKSEYDEDYKTGIWVRDSSAGIGTMTYYDPETLGFAGLGHAICDVDTGNVMPLSSGEIVDVTILGANAGHSGRPGELKGSFVGTDPLGKLLLNCENGIYGILEQPVGLGEPVAMAMRQEIQPGPAVILATISGNKPQSFDIMIEKVNYSDTTSTKNMVIKVVDADLLAATGGIVQGMSGSPILQGGKLVGAVTHVFVNDPTRGYGIFAENMDRTLKKIETNNSSV